MINTVSKSAECCDRIAVAHNIIDFEMEAAVACGKLTCIGTKKICDYADGHKHESW
ncbi:hypothetical protein M441DRAFT_130497 [Trichoderma asperellum CBS 433.97]|uniref:Uncharacterized protein n=1 Tax=Trichoderma asperellum (strain ATCC 204424 / CBS 433.97 / NBRC 101777) TaxID=1042311 RepID=A0A2T3ZLH2_TRIA4|nr:hypothetical protein M441DRAFT_130497 [Trichoderma asperellum CBS 433.97]PTB45632.1 hypothetical protein M441DRAFT_130497 [Trichoderma asperellum CBS 433.97]